MPGRWEQQVIAGTQQGEDERQAVFLRAAKVAAELGKPEGNWDHVYSDNTLSIYSRENEVTVELNLSFMIVTVVKQNPREGSVLWKGWETANQYLKNLMCVYRIPAS